MSHVPRPTRMKTSSVTSRSLPKKHSCYDLQNISLADPLALLVSINFNGATHSDTLATAQSWGTGE